MSNAQELKVMFPVGRFVQGDLYEPNKTDAKGAPMVYKNGPDAGKPRVEYYLAVAFPKTAAHWAQEPWGQQIWAFGHSVWPAGQAKIGTFAWKITDGDSDVPNKKMKKPCDLPGHKGHWVVKFSSSFAPQICNANGTQPIPDIGAVKCGYFVQVYALLKPNGSADSPGIYMNHLAVALSAYGEVIEGASGVDTAAAGFGGVLPAGASPVPLTNMSAPAELPPPPAAAAPPPPVPTPAPNTAFVAGAAGAVPPPPAAAAPPPPPAKVMTAKAAEAGYTYDSLIAANWTEAQMIQHGYLQA